MPAPATAEAHDAGAWVLRPSFRVALSVGFMALLALIAVAANVGGAAWPAVALLALADGLGLGMVLQAQRQR